MDIWRAVRVICVVTTSLGFVAGNIFQDCFRRDSISCLQMQLFQATRQFVDNSNIEILGGLGLVKTRATEGKSLEQKQTEESVENALDVESRQKALENYLIVSGTKLWKERTVAWNPAQAAKALVYAIPDSVTSQLTSFVSEARSKEKKQMKQLQVLMPFLIALKLKFATLSTVALMVIAAIAKKAILAAVISLLLSGLTGIKSLTSSKPQLQAGEVMGYHAAPDWDAYTYGGGRYSNYDRGDLRASRSEPAPKKQILLGHKAS